MNGIRKQEKIYAPIHAGCLRGRNRVGITRCCGGGVHSGYEVIPGTGARVYITHTDGKMSINTLVWEKVQ
jgi:hypothetical protein